MNSQRISLTHLQFAQKSQQHIAKEYVMPPLQARRKIVRRQQLTILLTNSPKMYTLLTNPYNQIPLLNIKIVQTNSIYWIIINVVMAYPPICGSLDKEQGRK